MVTLQYSYLLKVYEHEKPPLLLCFFMLSYVVQAYEFSGIPHRVVNSDGTTIASAGEEQYIPKYFPVPNNIQK